MRDLKTYLFVLQYIRILFLYIYIPCVIVNVHLRLAMNENLSSSAIGVPWLSWSCEPCNIYVSFTFTTTYFVCVWFWIFFFLITGIGLRGTMQQDRTSLMPHLWFAKDAYYSNCVIAKLKKIIPRKSTGRAKTSTNPSFNLFLVVFITKSKWGLIKHSHVCCYLLTCDKRGWFWRSHAEVIKGSLAATYGYIQGTLYAVEVQKDKVNAMTNDVGSSMLCCLRG